MSRGPSGVSLAVKHRGEHRRHADLGQKQYLGLPYYGRWLVSAARVMLDKQHITLTELTAKIEEVKKRHEQKR